MKSKLKVYSYILDGFYSISYLVAYYEESQKKDIYWKLENDKSIPTDHIDYIINNFNLFTDLELGIFIYLIGKRKRTITAHHISKSNAEYRQYGAKGKQIIGMTIGRMKKKGIDANYGALK